VLTALGFAALFGAADSAIDSAVDPKPAESNTVEGQRKLFDWQQRHQPSFDDSSVSF